MNVNEIVRLTLMPIIAAASWSWAVARIALPCFVERTSQVRIEEHGDGDQDDHELVPAHRDVADRERRARVEISGGALR